MRINMGAQHVDSKHLSSVSKQTSIIKNQSNQQIYLLMLIRVKTKRNLNVV